MAEFGIADIERLLKAILPEGRPDPFGELRDQLLAIAEEQLAFDGKYDANFELTNVRLDSIESRTFGILFLQIIKILRTLFALLPPGRLILILIAVIGLAATFMESGSVTGSDIRRAVEESGLGRFIQEQIRRLNAIVEEQAERVETVIDLGTDVVRSASVKADAVLIDLTALANNAATQSAEEFQDYARATLAQTLEVGEGLSNLVANLDGLIFGALRAIPDRIREIPALAQQLTE